VNTRGCSRLVLALSATLLLAGTGYLGSGVYILAKAELAQVLIERAWRRAQDGDRQARPWSWADTWPIARLTLPDQGGELMVLAGASGRNLAFGPAHVSATPAPGAGGNAVLVGHRDTHFAALEDVVVGQIVRLQTVEAAHEYEVVGTAVVHESAMALLENTARDTLTLITCYPFAAIDPATEWRYVVRAQRKGAAS